MPTSLEQGPLKEAAILTRAVENVFRKLIRLLIGRMSLTKLQEMIRIIFVEEAERRLELDRPGKNVPLTKLALLTGLDTRTLNKILDESISGASLSRKKKFLKEITPECSVLDYWNTNSKYFDKKQGKPLELAVKGKKGSFESLVKDAISSRGVTSSSLLLRLCESKSVELNKKTKTIRLVDSRYFPFEMEGDIGAVELGLAAVGNLVETIVHNVESKSEPSELYFQRSNWTNRLNKKDLALFRLAAREFLDTSERKSIGLIASIEEEESESTQITAGISMFYFEEEA